MLFFLEKQGKTGRIKSIVKKLPFEITPQIKRYLKELLVFHEQFCVKTDRTFILHTYTNKETPTEKNDNNIFDFFEYFFEIGSLEDAGNSEFGTLSEEKSGLEGGFKYVTSYTVKILNIKPIKTLLKKVESAAKKEVEKPDVLNKSDIKRLISMDTEGDFFRGKQKDILPVRTKEDDAYRIFVSIYRLTDGAGGQIMYQNISGYMKANYKKEVSVKKISNAIDNTIIRKYFSRINATPDGRKILRRDGVGKSIYFYNPVIE
ncbi:MAG: hypothetical protein AAB446_02090 [Patescibacteria group bacterium]